MPRAGALTRRRLIVAAAVVVALVAAWSASMALPRPGGRPYTLMQTNLCLSGLAGCYGKVAYPAGVDDAVAQIRQVRPDAVTLNETCRGDVERIARQTGYHMRFSRVIYEGRRLQCIHPGGRGLFGDAVLTRAPIESTDNHDFKAQAG